MGIPPKYFPLENCHIECYLTSLDFPHRVIKDLTMFTPQGHENLDSFNKIRSAC